MGMRDTGRGAGYTKHFDETLRAGVYETQVPNMAFLYRASTTQDPDWAVGDRFVAPDGREFVYAKSSSALAAGTACEFAAMGAIAYDALGANQAAGDTQVTVAATATHDELAVDELRGGYIQIYQESQFRGIVGNDASLEDAAVTIYLDAPLAVAVTTATNVEVFQNPYASLYEAGNEARPIAGCPVVTVSATLTYFWVQVKGPIWVTPNGSVNGNEAMGCFWREDGSLMAADETFGISTAGNNTSQYAGHILEGNEDNNGPLFMLQG